MKTKKIIISSALALTLLGLSGIRPSETVLADAVSENSAASDLAEAIAAGYTVEEYEQILNIPDMEPEAIIDDAEFPLMRSLSPQQAIISLAKQQLNKPYVWGASGPNSFDCSGLVQYTFKNATGINLPRVSADQGKQGTSVSLNSLQPGDLLFWSEKGSTYHVAIYIGNNQFIHAPKPGQSVRVASISSGWKPTYAQRIIQTAKIAPSTNGQASNERYIFRMYNSGLNVQHYTTSLNEATTLQSRGWDYEGVGWVSPTQGTPVYRVYNSNIQRHHYTTSINEKNNLVKSGWNEEGISWHSGGGVPVYRVFKSDMKRHHYTTSVNEKK